MRLVPNILDLPAIIRASTCPYANVGLNNMVEKLTDVPWEVMMAHRMVFSAVPGVR